ncbi:MAG: c-type cytochrome [Deltaproteobacteria bacterium]|nr:c-type cytochrome [Deltaproteobacteria bacterium]
MALAGRERSFSFVWFLLAGVLMVLVAWFVYDEAIGRRSWKIYAQEWAELETKRLQEAIAKESKNVDPKKLKQIELEREKAQQALEGQEFADLSNELIARQNALDVANQNLQFAKADLDEIFYMWKHSQHEGHDFSEHKKHYEEVEAKIKKLTEVQTQRETELFAVQEKINILKNKLKDLDVQKTGLTKKVDALQKQLDAVQDRGDPIDQYVLPDLGKAGAVSWGTVDRCTSCHIPILKPGYEKLKEPFNTHPHINEIFNKHPVEDYGCVTCHGGQGRATQIKGKPLEEGDYAHGFEHHWKTPLLRGDFVQSSCNKCHVQQFNLDLAPTYTLGKHLFVNYGCINCHLVKGLEWAPKSGPDLTKIKDKVYPEWFLAWVKKPTDYLPKTKMPQVPWKNEKDPILAMSYILSKSEPFNWKYGKFPGGSVEKGKELFTSVGCFACHNLDGEGGGSGPALDRIAEKTSSDWIYNWIQDPKNWSASHRMPSLRLTQDEAADITAYVASHGKKPDEDAALRAALADPENVKEGFRVINTYGCYACHNIAGFEKASNPSVELTNFSRKDVSELAFGDAKIPETWEAWTDGKLRNPQMFVDERSSSFMPKPNIDDEQRHALLVFLKGQAPEALPQKYIAFDPEIENGRHLVNKYNCKACHVIEGEGQDVAKWIKEPNFLPPNLASTGARLQTDWMRGFLHNPGDYPKVRSWLNIRMPTFQMDNSEVEALVKYFKKYDHAEGLLEVVDVKATPEEVAAAQKLMGPENFNCYSCHIFEGKFPEGGPTVWAPNLAYAHERIRPQWLNKWVRNPGDLVPGTRMPGYYPEPNSGPKDVLDGNDEKQIDAIVHYIMSIGKKAGVVPSEEGKPSAESKPADQGEKKPEEAAKTPQAKL